MKPRDHAVMAIFFGPVAGMGDEIASYVMLRHPHIVTVVAAVIAVTGLAISYRVLRARIEVFPVDRFLALFGVLINLFFLFLILFGFGIPKLVVHPTD